MATPDSRTADALVTSHAPLVGYAVAELATRLPGAVSAEALIAAGLHGLAAAAHSYKENRTGEFAPAARRHVAAALAAVVAGHGQPSVPAAGNPWVGELRAELDPVLGDCSALLLASAHPAAFAAQPQSPRPGAGHYASVAAASEYRSHLARRRAGGPEAAPLHHLGT